MGRKTRVYLIMSSALAVEEKGIKCSITEEKDKSMLALIASGYGLMEAAEKVNTNYTAFLGRVQKNPELKKAYEEARLVKSQLKDEVFKDAADRLLDKAIKAHNDLFFDPNGKVKLGATRLAYQLNDKLPRSGIVINNNNGTQNNTNFYYPETWDKTQEKAPVITIEAVDITSSDAVQWKSTHFPESDY